MPSSVWQWGTDWSSLTTSSFPGTVTTSTSITAISAAAACTAEDSGIKPLSTRKAVVELRRLSGLTWEQLGELLNVSRRRVQSWSNGQTLSDENEDHLRRVLDVVRTADRGLSRFNRAALLDVVDGTSMLEFLANGQYTIARNRLGRGPGRVERDTTLLSPYEQLVRTPPSAEDLVNARFERIQTNHEETRPGRAWKPAESDR